MFESNILNWFECGALCMNTRFCVGFNFKKKTTDGQINCQLTHSGNQTFERISTENNDWTFYKTEGEELVRVLCNCIYSELRCEVRKFVAKFKSSFQNSQAGL